MPRLHMPRLHLPRLHIVGCPRSGTTLLMELLATCFHCQRQGGHEMSIFTPFSPHPDGHSAPVQLSKQPTDILHVARLLPLDPDLHVVCLTRDPRAVVSSRHAANPDYSYFANYRIWKQCDRASRALRQHPRVLLLRYEELVSYPDIYQQIISDRFPFMEQIHPFSAFAQHSQPDPAAMEAMNGLRPIDTRGLRNWRQHLPRVKAQLLANPGMQADLEYHHYEFNAGWQSMLETVVEQQFSCRYPERTKYLKEAEKKLRVWFKLIAYRQRLNLNHTTLPAAALESGCPSLQKT